MLMPQTSCQPMSQRNQSECLFRKGRYLLGPRPVDRGNPLLNRVLSHAESLVSSLYGKYSLFDHLKGVLPVQALRFFGPPASVEPRVHDWAP